MNEIKTVHLGRQQFTIALDAHHTLKAYLDEITQQVGPKGKELLKEVELRIAELLLERGISGDKVVLAEDIAYVKEQLGEPRDFKEDDDVDEKTKASSEQSDGPKRLYRDPANGMVAGVASGLAAYFNIDVIIPRLIFIVLTFTGGAGIFIYILLWILAPPAESSSDRLKMQGKAVTVNSLKEVVDRADIPGAASRIGRSSGRFIGGFLNLLRVVVGIFITVMATLFFTAIMVTGFYMLIHGVSVSGEKIFPLDTSEIAGLSSAIVALTILALFMLLLGDAVVKRKWKIPAWLTAAGMGLFIITLSIATAVGIKAAPNIKQRYETLHVSKTFMLDRFANVDLRGEDTTFVFKPSNEYKMEVSYYGSRDVDEVLDKKVENGVLTINTNKPKSHMDCFGLCFETSGYKTVTIYAPQLDIMQLEGDVNFRNNGLNQTTMTMQVGKEAYAVLSDSRFAKVTIDTSYPNGSYSAKLDGITAARAHGFALQIQPEVGGTTVVTADEVQLKTLDGEQCENGEGLVDVANVKSMTINSTTVASLDALRRLHTQESASIYNCLGAPESNGNY